MLDPADLTLPSKFSSWRPGQYDIIVKAATCKEYAFLLDSPTGTGKSLIGAAVQRIRDIPVVYLVQTKQLQDQIMYDFPYAKTVKGRSNYKCLKYPKMYPTISAEECSHTKDRPCNLQEKCPYLVAKIAAIGAGLAVLNYAYFLSEANFVGGFSERKLIIADELDVVEDQLMNHISLVITQKMLDRLDVPPPKFKTKFESWVEWAKPTKQKLEKEVIDHEAAARHSGAWTTDDAKTIRRVTELKRIVGKLGFFIREVDKNWVWYPEEERWTFKPVWIAKYAPGAIWDHTKRVLGMSATILDPLQVSRNIGITLSLDGLGLRSYLYQKMPSPFPKEHRPIYYNPVADLTYKTMDVELPKLVKAAQGVLDKHLNEKILVHTVSYKVRDALYRGLTPSSRLITHGTLDRTEKLELYKQSKEPRVLLSPSMDRGVDLPDDLCRVVLIAKTPFPDLGDPQIQRRVYQSNDGNHWYAHKAVSTVVQMSGRGVRSADDYAVTYILDAQFDRLLSKNKRLFPDWWQEALIV